MFRGFFFFLTRGFPANKADDRKGFSPRELEAYSLVADEVPVVTLNMRIPRSRIFHSAITANTVDYFGDVYCIENLLPNRGFARIVGSVSRFFTGVLTNSRSPSTNYRGFRGARGPSGGRYLYAKLSRDRA